MVFLLFIHILTLMSQSNKKMRRFRGWLLEQECMFVGECLENFINCEVKYDQIIFKKNKRDTIMGRGYIDECDENIKRSKR